MTIMDARTRTRCGKASPKVRSRARSPMCSPSTSRAHVQNRECSCPWASSPWIRTGLAPNPVHAQYVVVLCVNHPPQPFLPKYCIGRDEHLVTDVGGNMCLHIHRQTSHTSPPQRHKPILHKYVGVPGHGTSRPENQYQYRDRFPAPQRSVHAAMLR